MTQHTILERQIDDTVYRMEVPTEAPKRDRANRVIKDAHWRGFEDRIAEHIVTTGVCGSEGFRFLRKFCGYSMVQLGTMLGVDRSTVHRWEAGKMPIPRSTMGLVMGMAAARVAPKVLERLGELVESLSSPDGRRVEVTLDAA